MSVQVLSVHGSDAVFFVCPPDSEDLCLCLIYHLSWVCDQLIDEQSQSQGLPRKGNLSDSSSGEIFRALGNLQCPMRVGC